MISLGAIGKIFYTPTFFFTVGMPENIMSREVFEKNPKKKFDVFLNLNVGKTWEAGSISGEE